MVRRGQPPKLLSRVIRAVAGLKEQKGSTINHIMDHVRKELNIQGSITRNVADQIRRALKYAVSMGALFVKYGKYKMAMKSSVVPVDSLELTMDCRARRGRHRQARQHKLGKLRKKVRFNLSTKKHTKKCHRRKTSDDHDNSKRTHRHHHHHKSKPKKSNQNKKQDLLEKKTEPCAETPPSESSQDETLPSRHKVPSPNDQNENLNKKRNRQRTETSHTSYPGYKDTMPGDDSKSLSKVPEKPRRPRRPVLPSGKEQNKTSADPEPVAHEDNDKDKSEYVKACHRHSHSRSRSRSGSRNRSQKQRSRNKSRRRKHHDNDYDDYY